MTHADPLLPAQTAALLEDETDLIAGLANAAALLYNGLPAVNWAGFYFRKGDALVLGPFQGKPACSRLTLDRGVCATAARRDETVVVADVHRFEGHIACDSASRSEIVVPLHLDGVIYAVLDIDSPTPDRFAGDAPTIEAAARAIEAFLSQLPH